MSNHQIHHNICTQKHKYILGFSFHSQRQFTATVHLCALHMHIHTKLMIGMVHWFQHRLACESGDCTVGCVTGGAGVACSCARDG